MIWALVLALTLIATPAAAEFTANEKTNVRSLILGVNLIRSGLQDQIAAESLSGYATAWQDQHGPLGPDQRLHGPQPKARGAFRR